MPTDPGQIGGWLDLIGRGGMPLVIAGLLYVAYLLWREIGRRDEAIAARDGVIRELQDKRAVDGMTYARMLAEKTAESAASVQALTNQLAAWADRVQGLAELIRPINPEMARIIAAVERNADMLTRLMTGGGR